MKGLRCLVRVRGDTKDSDCYGRNCTTEQHRPPHKSDNNNLRPRILLLTFMKVSSFPRWVHTHQSRAGVL